MSDQQRQHQQRLRPASNPAMDPRPSSSQLLTPAGSSSSRRPRQKPVTYCLPPAAWSTNVTDHDAQLSLNKLVAAQSQRQGFDAASSSALHELSHLTQRFMLSIFAAATHGAEMANRDAPSARDLVYSLETHDLPVHELRHFARKQQDPPPSHTAKGSDKARAAFPGPSARTIDTDDGSHDGYGWTDPTSSFLPSDSESDEASDVWSVSSDSDGGLGSANRKAALEARVHRKQQRRQRTEARRLRREKKTIADATSGSALDVSALEEGERAWKRIADHVIPKHLPGRPPRHCWIQTAAYPPNAYSSDRPGGSVAASNPLVLINRKLANARLVEASLRKLIQSTDSVAAQAMAVPRPSHGNGNGNASGSGAGVVAATAPASSSSAAAATTSASATSEGVFATPKVPSRTGLTLRLKNKNSVSATLSSILGGIDTAAVATQLPMMTPLPRSRRDTMTTPTGFPSLDPLASPITPASGIGGPMTPYPPTPSAVGVAGHYSGSQGFGWNQRGNAGAGGAAVPRSRSGSMAAASPGLATNEAEQGEDGGMPVRMPGAVNYKNVWYAPGSGGGGGGGAKNSGGVETSRGGVGRGVKRMRKWKV